MIRKLFLAFVGAIILVFSLIVSNSLWSSILVNFGFGLSILIIGIYYLSLGVIILLDSKKIVKTLIYQIIPFVFLLLFLPLINLFGAVGEPETPYKLITAFTIGLIIYLSPIICYLIYIKFENKHAR